MPIKKKTMKRILPLLLFLFPCLLQSYQASSQQPYNVIFIVVDDLNIQFDAYGNPDAQAPNFARLLQHGLWFKQTYCQYGLCNPSRTSFLSGKRPDATGVFSNSQSMRTLLGNSYKFLGEYFHAYGYRTERFGKASCDHENEMSWDYYYDAPNRHYQTKGTPYWWIDTTGQNPDQTRYGVQTDSMIKKLRNPVAFPYFYLLGLSTHNPFTPTITDWNRTGDNTVQELLPVDIKGHKTNVYGNGSGNITLPNTPVDDTNDIPKVALKGLTAYPDDEFKRIKHAYYSEVMQSDYLLGEVLDEIDSQNLWSNSVIVFISDNGLNLGEHLGVWLKGTIFEETLRLPFVICAPGKKTGVCNTPVEAVDLYPTLTELCKLPTPSGMEGSSLVPLLEKPDILWKKAIFAQVSRTSGTFGRSVRTSDFHYNDWETDGEELYDMVNDPNEYNNLVGNPNYQTTLNQMRTLKAQGWQNALPPAYPKITYYKDADDDGYGSNTDSIVVYFPPDDSYVTTKGDCDDNNNNIYPGASEVCDGVDNNCNFQVDENKPSKVITANGSLDICATGSVQLQAEATGAEYSYQWVRNGVNISGATSNTYTATKKGNYAVAISSSITNCSVNSSSLKVTKSCAPVAAGGAQSSDATVALSAASVYPNPAKNQLTVKYYSATAIAIELRVTDMNGKLLITKQLSAAAGENLFHVNISNLAAGSYLLQLISDKENRSLKFVAEK